MRRTLACLLAAATFGGAVAGPGQALADPHHGRHYDDGRRYDGRYYRHHDDDDDGAAIAAGIVGLALGAALASGFNDDRGRVYDGRGYRSYDRYYSYDRGYYRAPPRPYTRTCRTERYWNGHNSYVDRTRCW